MTWSLCLETRYYSGVTCKKGRLPFLRNKKKYAFVLQEEENKGLRCSVMKYVKKLNKLGNRGGGEGECSPGNKRT